MTRSMLQYQTDDGRIVNVEGVTRVIVSDVLAVTVRRCGKVYVSESEVDTRDREVLRASGASFPADPDQQEKERCSTKSS